MNGNTLLTVAAGLSFSAALAHVAIVLGGPDWYRFFGAGEQMASLAEAGSLRPAFITLLIATVLALWGLYGLSGAGVISPLPLLRPALVVITAVYLVRGIGGFILPFVSSHPAITQNSVTFWLVSSLICSLFGVCYLLGVLANWASLALAKG
ncbi:hypothetical protein LJ739_11205 [Aestuariibacter halophilus]|uniref:DUF3995 domain-containing protein n=1 Tax=Fluctibacter halophilus TaxID=226011 RepID=A0ABS8GAR8_9ALTE|nr:hypothetical protein [Aestuariibacter halophilus]MCC2616809.1 hypothetical protein [Aestuariibacter halophilus]